MLVGAGLRTALARFFGLQERQGRFLSNGDEVYKIAMLFCRRYVDLAKLGIRQVFLKDFVRLNVHRKQQLSYHISSHVWEI